MQKASFFTVALLDCSLIPKYLVANSITAQLLLLFFFIGYQTAPFKFYH